jgi:hypothetical protein
MPKLTFISEDGRLPAGDRLKRDAQRLLVWQYDAVIALTDVYTGSRPSEFKDADDAKPTMSQWVGKEPRCHPHAAQFEFEAWQQPRRTIGPSRDGQSRKASSVALGRSLPQRRQKAGLFKDRRRRGNSAR